MNTTDALVQGNGEMYDEPMEQGRNPLMVLHLLLQGRYWLALLLAVVLAAGGAALGYMLSKRTYSSTGMIHIKPVVQTAIRTGGDSGSIPMFDSFVASQLILLRSQRVIDMAIGQLTSSAAWEHAGKGTSEIDPENFLKNLDVGREGEIVRVAYTDPNPEVASEAVRAVIDSYSRLYLEAENTSNIEQRRTVTQLRDGYIDRLKALDGQIQDITGNLGADAEEARAQTLTMNLNTAELSLNHANEEWEKWKTLHPDGVAPSSQPKVVNTQTDLPKVWTEEEMARFDANLDMALRNRERIAQELDSFGNQGSGNPAKRRVLNQQDANEKKIQDLVAKFKAPTGAAAVINETDMGGALKNQVDMYTRQKEEAYQELQKQGAINAKVHAIQLDVELVRQYLESAKQKLEQMNVESTSSGRINVISTGDRPVLHDKRMPVAAAAAFGGGVAGVGLVLLIGLMDRRLRTIDQARMSLKSGMRVLGMLPSLPRNLEDPGAASFAALCVHHIRMLLQVMPRMDTHPVIAVTSPSPGDGKTSLTLALALSFAASGKSTLLIDCDIVGAGLTRRVNAIIRRRIGQILIRENLITPAQLREALNLAQRTGRKLGEVLVDEGFVEQEQVTHALAMQAETSVGLLDVMRGEVLEECVADTGMARLWILPVGSALAEHGATISPEGFRAVLEQARKRFDVVLVDTGPVPGSIESSVAASQADGVVLCVSRGEQGPLVRRASEHLHDIGSRTLGLVFNRATPEDFSSSYGAMSSPSIPARIPEKPGTDRATFGPVASAVAGSQVKKN